MKHGIDSDSSGHETQPPFQTLQTAASELQYRGKNTVFLYFYDGTSPLMCVNVAQLSKTQLW